MSKKLNIAVVGATGAVGEAMLSILSEYGYGDANVHALASEKSLGEAVGTIDAATLDTKMSPNV